MARLHLRPSSREKELSTKNREQRAKICPRRATKGLEEAREGSARGRQGERKDFQEKAKRFPRRTTKNGEGPRRGWRRPERDPPRVAKGRKDFQDKAKRFPRRTLGPSAKGTRIRELTRSKADKRTGRSQTAPGGSRTRTSPREGPLPVDRSASGDDRWQTSTSPRSPVGR